MKTINLKRVLLALLLIFITLLSSVFFTACKKEAESETLEIEGVNVILSEEEAESLLQQAEELSSVGAKSKRNWKKIHLLKVINQIKHNILNSTAIQIRTEYTIDDAECLEFGVVTLTESYNYVKQGNYVTERWVKNENGTLYEYIITNEPGLPTNTRTAIEPYDRNGVYDFCQGKFTFTCITLTEDDIEEFKIHKGNLYIKLRATIFNAGAVDVTESFNVKNGKISKDDLNWGNMNLPVEYLYNEDVDLSMLTLPENIDWQ